MRTILESGSDVNLQDKEGNSPLHVAVPGGHATCVKVLLATKDVRLDLTNRDGKDPRYYAKVRTVREPTT